MADFFVRGILFNHFQKVAGNVVARVHGFASLGYYQEVDLGGVGVISKHVDCRLKSALHWRNKNACDVDVGDMMCIFNALVNSDSVQAGVAKLRVGFEVLKGLPVLASVLYKNEVLVVKITEAMSD